MLGFVFGTLCLIGFVKVAFGRPWGWHRRFHHRPWHGRGLYHLFSRLDTSPGQEKAIRSAFSELMDAASAARPSLRELRSQLAVAFREDSFHPQQAEAALAGQQEELRRVQAVFAATLAKVHEALDPDQRRNLSRFIESGPGACSF
jgi:hypothetical protein